MPNLHTDFIAFDLDGVLVDTEAFNIGSAVEAFLAVEREIGVDEIRLIVGRHPDDYVPELLVHLGLDASSFDRVRALQDDVYRRMWEAEARMTDGADEVLSMLHREGIRLALATSGGREHVRACLGRFGIEAVFEFVLTKDDVPRRKPDPGVYLTCAERFEVQPADMVVVEDSSFGVRAAKAAGARCIAVRTKHTPADRIAAADAVIGSLADLPALIR